MNVFAAYRLPTLLVLSLALSACTLGPDYQRPQLQTPAQFKQIAGWSQAKPGDALARGSWWQLYRDAELNALVERLNVSNQNLAASEAQYRQARALVRGARAAFYPSLSSSAAATRSSQGSTDSAASSGVDKNYDLSLNAAWELDIWGKLRRSLESSRAGVEASAADLGGAETQPAGRTGAELPATACAG